MCCLICYDEAVSAAISRWVVGLLLAGGVGCTGRAGFLEADPDPTDATSDGGVASTFGDDDTPMPPPPPSDDGDPMPEPLPPEPLPPEDTGSNDDGGTFLLPPPDGGFGLYECDVLAQDCPPGEKCLAWANDGGPAWNATRCSPIAADPAGFGEGCQVEGSATSGIDDCDLGLMCWNVDENGIGECVHQCLGTYDNLLCPGPDEVCPASAEGVLLLCLPQCDPIVGSCDEGELCVPWSDTWFCAPEGGRESGAFGDPCEFVNACDVMHACIDAAALPGCEGSVACCSQLCNVLDDASDAACAALAPGTSCEAWYGEGQAPDGYEHVGVCTVPT